MIAAIHFDFPIGWQVGLPLAGAVLALAAWRQGRRGLSGRRVALMTALRGVPLIVLVVLCARPVWVAKEPPATTLRPVVLLMDHSESMSLEENDRTRYQQALGFARDYLLPALKSAGLPVQALVFAEDAEPADGTKLAETKPDGKRTNLGGAIARALASTATPPLAVIALTDGAANDNADNARGVSALVDARVPFVGVGFGSDQGDTRDRVGSGKVLRRPEFIAIDLQGFEQEGGCEVACKCEWQTELCGELRAVGAGTEQPNRHVGPGARVSNGPLSGYRGSEIGQQLG